MRGLTAFVLVTAVIAGLCAIAGVLFAHFHGRVSLVHAVAYSLWIGGALVTLLTAGSGSTSSTAGGARIVVGGRFAEGSAIPLPQTPFQYVLSGVVVVAIGVLVFLYA